MKKVRVSSSMKLAIMILNEIFALLLIIVLLFSLNYGVNSGSWEDLLSRKTYEQSDYFRTQSKNQITRAIRAASRATRFETMGQYDPNRLVDIEEYAQKRVISGEADTGSLCYRLGDLLKWAQAGWTYSLLEIDSEGNLSFDFENISNIYEIMEAEQIHGEESEAPSDPSERTGIPREEFVKELESYFSNSSDEWISYYQYYQNISGQGGNEEDFIYSKEILNETFVPANYGSIVEFARENGRDIGEIYEYLNATLNNIVSDLLAYRENTSLFGLDATNVRFYLLDKKNGNLYTNTEEVFSNSVQAKQKEIAEELKQLGAYVIYDNQDLSLDAENVNLTVTELYGYAENYGISCSDDYMMAIGIDTTYPVTDLLQQGYQNYINMQPWAWLALFAGIVAVIGYLATFIFLSITAGETDEAEGVQLMWFDYWKTEISACILVIVGVCGVLPVVLLNRYLEFLTTAGLIGLVGICENTLLLVGWLSLLRRAKTKTLWKNSVLYMVGGMIRRVFRNGQKTTKVVLAFLCFLFAQMLFASMGSTGRILNLMMNVIVGVVLVREAVWDQELQEGMKKFKEGDMDYRFDSSKFGGSRREIAEDLNGIQQAMMKSVSENMKNERMKTDLITNVSHDIKTPLTSIINYVDLLKRENIENERARGYIEILEQKSHRLKHLTEDLVEASKISSGNIKLELVTIQLQEMLCQTNGEFIEKFAVNNLTLVENIPQEPIFIRADGRRLWRVLENLYNNVAKYAMPNTRVYVDLVDTGSEARISIKNISEQSLNIDAKDLTERFIRGDVSRSTEGSGLGLSIARNLTELQGGKFDIYLDGDLFRVTIRFPKVQPEIFVQEPEIADEKSTEEAVLSENSDKIVDLKSEND